MSERTYKRIGLTGGIGAGKSTAAKRFRELGVLVLDADDISRASLKKVGACYSEVVALFGSEILAQDDEIDRKKLASIVFGDEEKRRQLNAIVHPYVIGTMFSRAEEALNKSGGIAVFEVPLLFESGMHEKMDRNILVACGEEQRVKRIIERDNTTRQAALARIRAQMPEEEKRLLANYILENDGTIEQLNAQIDALLEELSGIDVTDAENA
ncbi:Dephospho-CoA kinase [bioreactor metagenome]|uniref:Dephospho-CoA kinase n=1 Tax=bioreactor metagenome TaxID=1076179 RepID=A0A644YE60_9ZZZZ